MTTQPERYFVGAAASHDKAEPPPSQSPFCLGETLEHKSILAVIRLGIVFGQTKADEDREAQAVRLGDGDFKCRIEVGRWEFCIQ